MQEVIYRGGVLRNPIIVLVTLLLAASVSAQTDKSTSDAPQGWKEYVYRSDGFAITLPEAPKPHPDTSYPSATAYTAGGMTLRVIERPNACESVISDQVKGLEEVRSGKRKLGPSESRFKVDMSTVKHGNFEGYPFLEFEQVVPSGFQEYERWYCAGKRLYIFAAQWQSGQLKPAKVDKIVRSFQLLKP